MSDIAIKVEGLSKAYQLGEFSTGTLTSDIQRKWALIRGKEDPFLKIGELNDRSTKGGSNIVWSLKDINFEIKKGDAIGVIGRNGAGKSTLLKLLSRVTSPTTGSIKVNGRIASLLEVGTGFHPELTGRENIYLNGAILGMRKAEIKKQFDAIVDFSGVERYVDTPVKRYSSGMYVRLAFAVAAHLESEILIVDEVLAVGDAEFQKKCLGKMNDVSKGEGRTVLFVSHNLHSIMTLCEKGIYLQNGILKLNDNVIEVTKAYARDRDVDFSKNVKVISAGKQAWLTNFRLLNNEGKEYVQVNSSVTVEFEIEAVTTIANVYVGLGVNDSLDIRLLTLFSRFYNKSYTLNAGVNIFTCKIDNFNLKPGLYKAEIVIGNDQFTLDYYDGGLHFEIFPSHEVAGLMPDSGQGSMYINQQWL